jgi:hypothetical protein
VEVETHPVNQNEYEFLLGGQIRQIGDFPLASHFVASPLKGTPKRAESFSFPGRTAKYEQRTREKEDVPKTASTALIPRISIDREMLRRTVVVGFAEAATAAEVVWSLIEEGCDVIAFARRGRPSALRHSRHVICHDICAPELDLQTAVTELSSLLISVNQNSCNAKRILFPLDDKAVLLCSRVQIGEGWMLAGPDGAQAELALNKYLQVQLATRSSFNVPKSVLARTANDVRSFVAEQSYPIILKSAECVPVNDNRVRTCPHWICANGSELSRALAEWGEGVPLLIQPFITGTGEGIFGLATSDGIRAWSAHRRLRMMNPQGSGSSACISQLVTEDIKSKAEQFVKLAGWRGMFMIELLRERSGKIWFVELNGRPWGSMALSRRQELEYPAWQVRLAVDPHSQVGLAASPAAGIVSRHVGRELMHLLFVLRGPKSKALSNWPSFWKSAADVFRFRRQDTLYNWRREDVKVFLADVWYTIQNNLFKSRN